MNPHCLFTSQFLSILQSSPDSLHRAGLDACTLICHDLINLVPCMIAVDFLLCPHFSMSSNLLEGRDSVHLSIHVFPTPVPMSVLDMQGRH